MNLMESLCTHELWIWFIEFNLVIQNFIEGLHTRGFKVSYSWLSGSSEEGGRGSGEYASKVSRDCDWGCGWSIHTQCCCGRMQQDNILCYGPFCHHWGSRQSWLQRNLQPHQSISGMASYWNIITFLWKFCKCGKHTHLCC